MNISGVNLNQINIAKRKSTISYIQALYILVAVELVIALVWSTCCLYFYNTLGSPIVDWWYFGVAALGLLILLLFISHLVYPAK